MSVPWFPTPPHTSHELRPVFQITEVALEYNNCHGDQVVERLLQHLRRADAPGFKSLAPESPARLPDPPLIKASPCCNTVVLPRWHSISRTHNVCELCHAPLFRGPTAFQNPLMAPHCLSA